MCVYLLTVCKKKYTHTKKQQCLCRLQTPGLCFMFQSVLVYLPHDILFSQEIKWKGHRSGLRRFSPVSHCIAIIAYTLFELFYRLVDIFSCVQHQYLLLKVSHTDRSIHLLWISSSMNYTKLNGFIWTQNSGKIPKSEHVHKGKYIPQTQILCKFVTYI